MILDIRIYLIITLFAIVCLSLIMYNFLALYHNRNSLPSTRKIEKWQKKIVKGRKPFWRLRKTKNLAAYALALETMAPATLEPKKFTKLAKIYGKKHSACRAFYANFIANFPQLVDMEKDEITDTLISYIDDNVYNRTNVLRALCGLGSAQGVVKALHKINNTYFLHNQLLTDALETFNGNKEDFAQLLWEEGGNWNASITTGVIDYITKTSHRYGAEFMPLLQNPSTDEKIRAAVVRYYGKHIYEPARAILIELMLNPTYVNVAAQAAEALSLYPTKDTSEALRIALYSTYWEVRYAASSSLIAITGTIELRKILQNESNFATEIAQYILETTHQSPTESGERVSA